MQVDVVGAGPGGAYAALLLKKAHPDWSVTVHEQYAPATTYGWGVVLPGKVYPELRAADAPTCERIEAVNASWDPIDNYHRGERVRCGGHPYTSVMRSDLLEILQERCESLGVELRFETTADPEALRPETDLLVGADGITSETRAAFAEAFDPTLTRHADVYAWFGTDHPYEALSHIYAENEDGVWHGAAYPGETSTFIVDADESTWRAAGFEDADEAEYRAYLEAVFDDALGEAGLRSKEDRWRHFVTVENDRWHDGDVVLLGDAAATAHYTIGSGTRMAMESAIALAEGVDRHPDDLPAALEWYQGQRKPHVSALQSAAELSVTHFEHLERYIDLAPMQLAFLYLTRTGYNTYEALRERDPEFVDELDRWFAGTVGDGAVVDAEPVDQPLALPGLGLANRLVVGPETGTDAGPTGIDPFEAVGAGLVLSGPLAVSPEGRRFSETPGLYTDEQAATWRTALAGFDGPPVAAELAHDGRRAAAEPIAPSAIPYGPDAPPPTAMDAGALERVRAAYVDAAERAASAGFALCSVDVGRGTLLGSFLSPLANERTDRYGGDPAARRRYPLEVVGAVRSAWPEERPLAVRNQLTDRHPDGLSVREGLEAAGAFRRAGADLLAPVAGGTVPGTDPPEAPARVRRYAHWVRHEVGAPTLALAPITDRDGANTVVAGGRADLCRVHPPEDGPLEL